MGTLADISTVLAVGGAALSGVCAFVAMFLKAPDEDSGTAYRVVYSIVNWAGWNKFRAKNADEV